MQDVYSSLFGLINCDSWVTDIIQARREEYSDLRQGVHFPENTLGFFSKTARIPSTDFDSVPDLEH